MTVLFKRGDFLVPGLNVFLFGVIGDEAAECMVAAGGSKIAKQVSEDVVTGEVRAGTTFIGHCTAQSTLT